MTEQDAPRADAAAEGLVAGPELDAEVARVVFGWVQAEPIIPAKHAPPGWVLIPAATCNRSWREAVRETEAAADAYVIVPPYSTDVGAAMLVFFATVKTHGHAEIVCDMEDYGREPGNIVTVAVGLDDVAYVTGKLPEAICRAALQVCRALQGGGGA